MRKYLQPGLLALCATGAALPLFGYAAIQSDHAAAVQSTWKPQEIRYSYMGFTTAYGCDAIESRLKSILATLGAHPQTKVRASGCLMNRPSRNLFVTITTATPVAADEENAASASTGKGEQEWLERLGVKSGFTDEPFAAAWKTMDLSQDRELDLQPGDCELMAGLRDHVLPKLAIEVVSDEVRCTPNQLSIVTPELTVSALVPLASADEMKAAS